MGFLAAVVVGVVTTAVVVGVVTAAVVVGVVTAAVVVGVVTKVVAVVVVFGMISMLPDDLKRVNIILIPCLNQNLFEVTWAFF